MFPFKFVSAIWVFMNRICLNIKADIPKIIHFYTIVLVVIYVSVKPILSVKMAALNGRETAHEARLNL